ncbi:MAG TPA: type III pantothenate kinase [Phycisphaerae bacterium]|nr:type III pantothenate kinase [Phycisphaerae bacterium]
MKTSYLKPVDALMVVDIGNTRIGLGTWDSDGIHDVIRVPIAQPGVWAEAVRKAWSGSEDAGRRAVALSSVAPDQTPRLTAVIEEVCRTEALSIPEDLPLPLKIDVDEPEGLGVDRVCSAAAAFERVGGPCAIASFGTATTIDCVSQDGVFMGGTIAPGLQLSCDALHDHTALLPRVEVAEPGGPFGRTTKEAILSGVALGAVGALREIVEQFATALGRWPYLVITGGNAALIGKLADFVDAVVPDLSLMGVALAYRKAAGQA